MPRWPSQIRNADPERDAAACAAIYAPYVEDGPISFEERAPERRRDGRADRAHLATHPWLVAERGGEVVGYAYACPHRERPAYRWAVDVSVYVAAGHVGEGIGREPLRGAVRAPAPQRFRMACAGITLPNEASVALHEASRLRPGRRRCREIGWKLGALARRRLVAAGAGARSHAERATRAAAAPSSLATRLPLADARRAEHPSAAPADASADQDEVLTEEDVYEALEEVIDPELGLDFVSLGLVYDVNIEGEEVYVTFTLTTPACPIGPQVSEQMKEFVGDLPGVTAVHPKMVFDPAWSPEMMTDDAKFALGF